MNEIFDRIMEMPPRQRVLMLVGGVGLIFFVYAYFLYWPRGAAITAKEGQVEAKRVERDRKAAMVANLDQAKKEVTDLRAALKEAVAQLPDTKEIPDLLSNISAVGRDAGLEIAQFRQREEVLRDFYAEVPVEVRVRGTYSQVEGFFNEVSKLTRIVNVSDVGMKSPSTVSDDPVRLETSLSATTFRFLDEAERERIRKQREKDKKS
jgi:type IV pilus assembly protein PilO